MAWMEAGDRENKKLFSLWDGCYLPSPISEENFTQKKIFYQRKKFFITRFNPKKTNCANENNLL